MQSTESARTVRRWNQFACSEWFRDAADCSMGIGGSSLIWSTIARWLAVPARLLVAGCSGGGWLPVNNQSLSLRSKTDRYYYVPALALSTHCCCCCCCQQRNYSRWRRSVSISKCRENYWKTQTVATDVSVVYTSRRSSLFDHYTTYRRRTSVEFDIICHAAISTCHMQASLTTVRCDNLIL